MAAPPTIISKKLSPKAFCILRRMFILMRSRNSGVISASRMAGALIFGKIALRTIFSMSSGTAMTTFGFSSSKARSITVGEGVLPRKVTWAPRVIS